MEGGKARHIKEAEMKTEEKKRLISKKQALESQHKHTSDEKEATEQYSMLIIRGMLLWFCVYEAYAMPDDPHI